MAGLSTPIRIVHLISGDLWAGAEVATWHLVRAQRQQPELAVRVVTFNPGELADRLRGSGIQVEVEPERGRRVWELLRAVRPRLRDADLVHAHRDKESLIAALSGRPWIATQHGRPEPRAGLSRASGALKRIADLGAKRLGARRVIAVSSEVADWLAPRVGRHKCVRVWNGIADPAAQIGLCPWRERPRRVGALGRLFPVKAFELAVDAVAACPDLELEILGEGPERGALEERIARRGAADRIHLRGHDPDPLPRVGSWRAMLVTSHHEGNPIGVMEALAVGTPVLSTDLRGVAEILAGRGGWIEPGRDPRRWARRLDRVVRDGEQGERISREARARFLDAFSDAVAAEGVLRVYRQALSGSRA
jgi:glycosyltransferase involved in cell wall biosynthesis